MAHWKNPWRDVVYVPIEELAECVVGIGTICKDIDGTSFIMTKELMLARWRDCSEKLDAYILPRSNGFHSIGIRYGNDGTSYLYPLGDREKVAALLRKYHS